MTQYDRQEIKTVTNATPIFRSKLQTEMVKGGRFLGYLQILKNEDYKREERSNAERTHQGEGMVIFITLISDHVLITSVWWALCLYRCSEAGKYRTC